MLSRSARGLAALYGGEAGLALGQGRARIAKAGLADRCCAAHLWPPTHDDHGLSSFTARVHGGDGRSARYSIRYARGYSTRYSIRYSTRYSIRLHEGGTLSSFRLPTLGTLSMSRFVLA